MHKETLPVILLNNIILMPNNDIRLEFENDISKNILEIAEVFTQNKVLIVSHTNNPPLVESLPLMGVVGIISHKLPLADGKVRVVITGLYRANVFEFRNIDEHLEVLEASISEIEDIIDPKEEKVLIRKLFHEIENYIKQLPYMSGNLLATIANINSLNKLIDIVVPQLPINIDRVYEYLYTKSQKERFNMILIDLYRELELINLEKSIDSKVKKELDANQKEYLLREKIKVIKQELGDITVKDDEIDSLKKAAEKLKAPE
jgi:ATP-dependent Lon protease